MIRLQDLGAAIYEENSLFTDQLESMIPQTIQSSIMTLICMAIVCCVFMFNFLTVTIAVASITSICLGNLVFGICFGIWFFTVMKLQLNYKKQQF